MGNGTALARRRSAGACLQAGGERLRAWMQRSVAALASAAMLVAPLPATVSVGSLGSASLSAGTAVTAGATASVGSLGPIGSTLGSLGSTMPWASMVAGTAGANASGSATVWSGRAVVAASVAAAWALAAPESRAQNAAGATAGAGGAGVAGAAQGAAGPSWDRERFIAAAASRGGSVPQRAAAYVHAIEEAVGQDPAAALATINRHVNQALVYSDDQAIWGVEDYWASPLESLAKGAGDCEDYAIAKFFGLIAAGVPTARMRMVYVRAAMPAANPGGAPRSIAHMVLAYYAQPNAEPLVLDNLVGDIRRASQRPDLTPVFSFNLDGLWEGAGSTTAGDPQRRISRWREVIAKVRQEGFR